MEPETRLFGLTPEIISNVAKRLSYSSIRQLFMTGNGHLASLLSRPRAITLLRLKVGDGSPMSPSNWSECFGDLQFLTELFCECDDPKSEDLNLSVLPRTLQHLELFFCGPSPSTPDCFKDGSTFNVGLTLPNLLTFQTNLVFGEECDPWLRTLPPLTTLELADCDFTILPDSLQSFKVTKMNTEEAKKLVFPPNLTHADLNCESIGDIAFLFKVVSSLPPSLTSLAFQGHSYHDGEEGIDCFSLLPHHGLLNLDIQLSSPAFTDYSHLPETLTSLHIAHINADNISQLPNGLLSLTLSHSVFSSSISLFVASLPRSLTSLRIMAPDSVESALIGTIDIPKGMANWDVISWDFGDEDAVFSLPSASLTRLRVGKIGPSVKNLPIWPHLKLFNTNSFPVLPSILDSLAFHSTQLRSIGTDNGDVTIEGIPESAGCIQNATDPIVRDRYEKISSFYGSHRSDSSDQRINRFSRYLKNVRIFNTDYIGDNLTIEVLPDSIEELLITNGQFTDLGVQPLSTWTHLTKLQLKNVSTITSASFKYLPRFLVTIVWEATESIFDSDFADLPRSIQTISFNSAIHLTDACIPLLPQYTKLLWVMKNRNITPKCFELLAADSKLRIYTANWTKHKM